MAFTPFHFDFWDIFIYQSKLKKTVLNTFWRCNTKYIILKSEKGKVRVTQEHCWAYIAKAVYLESSLLLPPEEHPLQKKKSKEV